MLNALPSSKVMGVSLQIMHLFVKSMCVSNACNTDFHLIIIPGDELLQPCIYLTLYLLHA